MIPKHRVPYTPQKEKRVLEYVQFVALCAEMIKIEWQMEAIDIRFKNPTINNHAKRIIESANQISKALSSISENTDRDGFMYDSSLQFYRAVKHFSLYPSDKIEELMDLIEENKITEVS